MTALLWARPIVAAALLALVGFYGWTAWRLEKDHARHPNQDLRG